MQQEKTVPALAAPPRAKDNPLTRSVAGIVGMVFLALIVLVCLGSMPWTLSSGTLPWAAQAEATAAVDPDAPEALGTGRVPARYNIGDPKQGRLPPFWWGPDEEQARRLNALVPESERERIAAAHGLDPLEVSLETTGPAASELRQHWPRFPLGTDILGRDLLVRALAGGGISIGIGISAALISVFIGTLYGAIAGYFGGKVDAVMMRIVDILFGLPYILLVVLLAVAMDAVLENIQIARAAEGRAELSAAQVQAVNVVTLLVAIGGVSWLVMARVVRGQVLSLKSQPFIEAARAVGVPVPMIFLRHLLPNLIGPIVVYATLTVPQAILQESFLSFLGIGVQPPLPSWGNLAAEGLAELNPYRSQWWMLLFPCLLLASTLLALNFVGEGLREAFDPKRARR